MPKRTIDHEPVAEVSSARVAKIAAKGIRTPEALTLNEIKVVCASVLTQRPNKKK